MIEEDIKELMEAVAELRLVLDWSGLSEAYAKSVEDLSKAEEEYNRLEDEVAYWKAQALGHKTRGVEHLSEDTRARARALILLDEEP